MRIALAQINPTVGDVAGNARLVIDAIAQAERDSADMLVTGELAIIGYPPRDLLLREGVVEACESAVQQVARETGRLHVLVGYPRRQPGGLRGLRNSIAVCHDGRVIAIADKQLLPGYDVFDEDRYFDPGSSTLVFNICKKRVGVLICEDLWHADDVDARANYSREPVREIASSGGCDVLVSLNASPFVSGKYARHIEQLREIATLVRAPVVSVNQVGANDDLVFDGRSIVVNQYGEVGAALPGFATAVEVVDIGSPRDALTVSVDPMREIFDAITLCVRDYFRKTGAKKAIIGLSGGIDSALTAVVASAAIGSENVTGVLMPSQYSSQGSIDDAHALVKNVGMCAPFEIPIHLVHDVLKVAVEEAVGEITRTVADENIQARARGVLLMAISNATPNSLLLSTSNKSEIAVGYSTLYGDMCGAVTPLGDLTKTRVYELSRWVNSNYASLGFQAPPIPQHSITKPPSAELRPNQTDQDSLPPYEDLDQIVEKYIDEEKSVETVVTETGMDEQLVRKFIRMIDQAQYKRDQAAVIPKVTPRAFGRGRVMPIVMKSAPGMAQAARNPREPDGSRKHSVPAIEPRP